MDSLSVINSPTLIGIITNCLELFGAHTHTHCLALVSEAVALFYQCHLTCRAVLSDPPGLGLGSPPESPRVPSGAWVSLLVLAAMSQGQIRLSQPRVMRGNGFSSAF